MKNKIWALLLLCMFLSLTSLHPVSAQVNNSVEKPKTAEDLFFEDPVGSYKIFRARLRAQGPNASFPEFKPVVDHLWEFINSDSFKTKVQQFPGLELELKEVQTLLTHVNLTFTFDDAESYPYGLPFEGPFPYRPTIDAIENAIRLIDKIDRLTPGSEAVPLYHFDRYAYHRHSLLADPDVVIFPTLRNLTFQDLIRARSVPIGFVGVVDHTTRVDRHHQSPLDFWYHDLNHVRRMTAYIAGRAKARGIETLRDKFKFYREMDDFISQKIIPNIKALPKGADPEIVAIRRIARVMIFEIVHETALTAERETILRDLTRGAGPQPFEHMMPREQSTVDDIESLRTANGNIQSGASVVKPNEGPNDPIRIRYFQDRALALLANLYNKLNFGFYDDPADPNRFVAPVGARKADYLVRAAKMVLVDILGEKDIPKDEELRALILSMDGGPEKFVYQRLQDHEGTKKQGPNATEPLSAEQIIMQVKEHAQQEGKRIFTLFGYSKLDYENKRQAMAGVRRELEKLNPSQWIINIGATEEGIGVAYQMAKTMGFETMGIVSTQALSYSGQFSPYVDSIYIVNDIHWGGFMPGTRTLTPATRAFLEVSDVISAHGGGENTAVTIAEAVTRRMDVRYTAAEMNHSIARKEATMANRPRPTDFRGPAFFAWQTLHAAVPGVSQSLGPGATVRSCLESI